MTRPASHIHGSLRQAICVPAFLLIAALASARELEVARNVNLRPDPSGTQAPIRLLLPGDELELLENQKTNNYFHVRTEDDKEGWVWSANVHIVTGPTPADSIQPSTLPADEVSSSWAKPTPNHSTFTSSGKTCGPTGDGGDTETNLRKNRTDVPSSYHVVAFDAIAKLAYPVAPKHRHDWSQSQLDQIVPFEGCAVTVSGYLVALKTQNHGSGESTNCHWTKSAESDWHMALTKLPGQGEEDAIVVETTPRIRKNHPKWTTTNLKPWVDSDDPIRVSGWLISSN
jgi:hypothetical protein